MRVACGALAAVLGATGPAAAAHNSLESTHSATETTTVYRAPVTANLAEPDQPLVSAAESRLDKAFSRLSLVPTPERETCSDSACWNERALDAGANYLVQVTIEDAGPDKQVVLEVTDLQSTEIVISSRETCELCGRNELVDLVGDVAANAARRVERQELATTVLRVQSDPADAQVFIDGVNVGPASQDHAITPGSHEVRVEFDGYVPSTRTVDVQQGSVAALGVRLAPIASAAPRKPSLDARPMVIGGAVVTAVGVAAVGASVVMLALHGRPMQGSCSGADVDNDGDCRFLHDTRLGGGVLLGAGVAAVVTGAVLLGVGLRRRRGERERQASVRPAGLGIDARF